MEKSEKQMDSSLFADAGDIWHIEVETIPKNDSRLLDAFDNYYEYIVDAANAKDKDGALLPPCIESPGSNSAYPF